MELYIGLSRQLREYGYGESWSAEATQRMHTPGLEDVVRTVIEEWMRRLAPSLFTEPAVVEVGWNECDYTELGFAEDDGEIEDWVYEHIEMIYRAIASNEVILWEALRRQGLESPGTADEVRPGVTLRDGRPYDPAEYGLEPQEEWEE